jgi:hypothetical protein
LIFAPTLVPSNIDRHELAAGDLADDLLQVLRTNFLLSAISRMMAGALILVSIWQRPEIALQRR